ncbi:precorrin-2 dehydrogenase/sirohydrochlorin ferrochelatase family protein [Paenibacillus soyae]|uniref:precorrin-2 dehydrogenase n=1 Tax=Paenibacillus soyae TaxID=2969249 RepID=A0A9X2MLU8_9BACL|nr:bifunctional precorrin-2 dehydrogenase/sirohydrochlorin ferrochelatase [Paenibacillus soyae]MCR2802615.1 bifunctional precorrin-2 dehydrogenase/sirohydrochlorin ferrochelatase [Paenibacillus soyae]
MESSASNGYYPVALRVAGRRCVIAGGGRVAERKLNGLLEAGADDVVLISPDVTEAIRRLAEEGRIRWERRTFIVSDLSDAWLVVAATSDRTLNGLIAEEADRHRLLANIADDYERGSYITPSVIRRGRLLVSVTATGASPAFARALKDDLEAKVGDRYGMALDRLDELRKLAQTTLQDSQMRLWVLRLAAEEALSKEWPESGGYDASAWLKHLVERVKGGLHNEQHG